MIIAKAVRLGEFPKKRQKLAFFDTGTEGELHIIQALTFDRVRLRVKAIWLQFDSAQEAQ